MYHKDRAVVRTVALAAIREAEEKDWPFFVHRGALCQYDGQSYRVCGENELAAEVCGQFDDLVKETKLIYKAVVSEVELRSVRLDAYEDESQFWLSGAGLNPAHMITLRNGLFLAQNFARGKRVTFMRSASITSSVSFRSASSRTLRGRLPAIRSMRPTVAGRRASRESMIGTYLTRNGSANACVPPCRG